MARLCERPGCSAVATVAFGFDATGRVVWLGPLVEQGPSAGRLCARHAESLVVPRGWWLDDRRSGDALFPSAEEPPESSSAPPAAVAAPVTSEPSAPAPSAVSAPSGATPDPGGGEAATPQRRRRRPAAGLPLGERGGETPGADPVAAWVPVFDSEDDVGGALDPATPLLARAFGRGPAPAPPPRARRPRTKKQAVEAVAAEAAAEPAVVSPVTEPAPPAEVAAELDEGRPPDEAVG